MVTGEIFFSGWGYLSDSLKEEVDEAGQDGHQKGYQNLHHINFFFGVFGFWYFVLKFGIFLLSVF